MKQVARKLLHAVPIAHRALSRYRGTLIHRAELSVPGALRLGSDYGGWTVMPRALNRGSVVYSVGVGSDISFDLAMIERFGCVIHAFDPTPMACAWIAEQTLPEQLHFHAVGLANQNAEMGFAAPQVAGHDSFSLPAEGSTLPLVMCPVRRLETIMADLGHSQLDLLKTDIEGFEFGVIEDVLAGPVRPGQWLIEFHHTMMHFTPAQTREAVELLGAVGYRLFDVSNVGHEYSFVHETLLT